MIKKLLIAGFILTTVNAGAQTYDYDLSVKMIHKNIYCEDTLVNHSVWVKNVGTESIWNTELFFRVGANPYQQYTYTDTIHPTDSVLISLGTLELEDGMNLVTDSLGLLNDTFVDANQANNLTSMYIHVFSPKLELPQSTGFDSGIEYNWLVLDKNLQFTQSTGNWFLGNLSNDYYGPDSSREVLMIDNLNRPVGDKSYFTSPLVTLPTGFKTVQFYHAYARRANVMLDKLELVYSLDCGQNWTLLWSKLGDELNSANPTSGVFIPKYDQWTFNQVDITNLLGDVIFAFVSTAGAGNFLYLDNIEIRMGGVSSTNDILAGNTVNIYPNPVTENLFIDIQSASAQTMNISVINVLGQQALPASTHQLKEGKNTVSIQTSALAPGVYMLQMGNGKNKLTKKFIIQ